MDLTASFEPRLYQVPAFKALFDGCKRIVTVWHRRAGKDLCAFNALWIYASQHRANYGYFFPFATQGRRAIWHGITEDQIGFREYVPPELIENVHDTEMRITLTNGSTIQFMGTDNYDSKMGANFAGIVMSEYSLQDPSAWDYIEPILVANGGWAWFTFTPRGRQNHGYDLYQAALKLQADGRSWFAEMLTVEDTGIVSVDQLDELRARGVPEAHIQQEYYCSFEQENTGAYFADQVAMIEQNGQIGRDVLWTPRDLVHTGWDLGASDLTCIWLLQRGKGHNWHAIDYIQNKNVGLEWYLTELERKPYKYGTHLVPHDADQRHFPLITSTVDEAANLGWDLEPMPKAAKRTQIDTMHRLIPRLWINSEKCEDGLRAVRNYERKWDERLRTFADTPIHNWASHATDAIMTFAIGEDQVRDYLSDEHLPARSSGGDFNVGDY